MTKKLMGLVGSLLIFCSAGSARIAVEQETGHGDLPQPLPVFVVEIQQNELTGEIGDLGSFASSRNGLRCFWQSFATCHASAA